MNEQLKEIEKRQARRKAAIDNPAVNDIDWLIGRVHELENRLTKIAELPQFDVEYDDGERGSYRVYCTSGNYVDADELHYFIEG